MTSTLGYAILGLLAREPMTGYELSRRLRTPIGYFWTAQHSQVYTELARLETGALVAHEVIDGPGPRDTKRYTATAAGRAELAAWVVTDPRPVPAKSDLLLRVYSIWLADPAAALDMLARTRAAHAASLERFQALLGPPELLVTDPRRADFGDIATLRAGVAYEQGIVGWLDWLCETMAAESD